MTAYQNTGNTNIPRESPYERSVSPIDDVHLYSSMNGNDIESSTGYQSLSNIRPGQQHQYTSIAISNEQTNSYAVYEEPYPDTAYEEPTISPNQDMGYEEPIIPSEQVTRYEELGLDEPRIHCTKNRSIHWTPPTQGMKYQSVHVIGYEMKNTDLMSFVFYVYRCYGIKIIHIVNDIVKCLFLYCNI